MLLGKTQQRNNIIVTTHTILHPCIDVMAVTEVKKPKCVCNINQARKALKRRHIFITDSDHYFILD